MVGLSWSIYSLLTPFLVPEFAGDQGIDLGNWYPLIRRDLDRSQFPLPDQPAYRGLRNP
jgi:hypothetical protein